MRKLFRYFKHLYQRMRYGVSSRDAWSLDSHIRNILARGIDYILVESDKYVVRSEKEKRNLCILKELSLRINNSAEITQAEWLECKEHEQMQSIPIAGSTLVRAEFDRCFQSSLWAKRVQELSNTYHAQWWLYLKKNLNKLWW